MKARISRRTIVIDGKRHRYTYNLRNREVRFPGLMPWTSLYYDAAPGEIREKLAQLAQQRA